MTKLRGRYEIIKPLGEGTFGNTYLSKDTDLPNHSYCVVKHLKKTPCYGVISESQKRFEEEARVLQRLGNYDQIPSLAAYFQEEGEFYLVQEFVDGHDLDQEIISGQKFSEEQTIQLLKEILEVLAIVHQQSVIHRDIKPSNIMRRRQDSKIVLIDFGAVKEIGAFTTNSKRETNLTKIIGTKGYMPSEQAIGRPGFASDVYAVGIIGIQMVTGLLPEKFSTDPNGEIIWRNHAQVSDEFADVLNKMVCYCFSQRYTNADEALSALISLTTTTSGKSGESSPPTYIPATTITSGKSGESSPPTYIPATTTTSSKSFLPTYISQPNQYLAPFIHKLLRVSLMLGFCVVVAMALVEIFSQDGPTQISHVQPITEKLEAFLKAGKWKDANLETWELMKKLTKREKEGWLNLKNYQNFPQQDLKKIDKLWAKHSNGKFGFSAQKQIWLDLGGKLDGEYDSDTFVKLSDRVGWRKNGEWAYDNHTFSTDVLTQGYLPILDNATGVPGGTTRIYAVLFSRL